MRKYFLSSICSLLNTFCIRNIFRSCKTRCVKTAIHSYQNCYEFRLLRYLAVFGNFVHYPASFSIHFGISSHRLYKYWTTFLKYWCKSSKASFNSPCNRFWVFKLKKVDPDKLAPFPMLSWCLSVSLLKTEMPQNHLLLLEIPAGGDRSENEILSEFYHNYKLHERAQTQRHRHLNFHLHSKIPNWFFFCLGQVLFAKWNTAISMPYTKA